MKRVLSFFLLSLGALFIAKAQVEQVRVVFASDLEAIHSKRIFEINAGVSSEVQPESDGYTYSVTKGATIRMEVTPAEGYVDYLWFEGAGEREREIAKSYNKKSYQIEDISASVTTVRVDCRKLVPITFIAPKEGSNGKMVQIDEQDDYGTEIKPTEPNGDVYMLPLNGSVYFDSAVDKDHFILCWLLDGLPFSAKPDIFYKQNIFEGMHIEVKFYKSGETRTVTYSQPKTAVIKCMDRGQYGSPEIESGGTVDPGNEILFEIAPFDNPDGKVELHHWVVNGQPYMSGNSLYTENSLSLYAFENLEVIAVPMAEYEAPEIKLSISPEIIDFGPVTAGITVSKTVTITAENAMEELTLKLRDPIPSITLSPDRLPSTGGEVTISYTPLAREIIDTKLICSTGEATASVPIKAKETTDLTSVEGEELPFVQLGNRLVWKQDISAKIYTTEGRLFAFGTFSKDTAFVLTPKQSYIVVVNGVATKVSIL